MTKLRCVWCGSEDMSKIIKDQILDYEETKVEFKCAKCFKFTEARYKLDRYFAKNEGRLG